MLIHLYGHEIAVGVLGHFPGSVVYCVICVVVCAVRQWLSIHIFESV